MVIVCTDADLGNVMALGCQRSGHVTLTFTDYGMGLHAVRATDPDLVILRLTRAETDGPRVGAAVKADPATRHVPLLAVTADPDLECAGADTILHLPFGLGEFGRCVDAALSRTPAIGRTG